MLSRLCRSPLFSSLPAALVILGLLVTRVETFSIRPRPTCRNHFIPTRPTRIRCCSNSFREHHLVDHVDQLNQQPVCPPHLFSLPASGGNICLVVDEKGRYYAVRDSFPPLGLPVSESGIVDTQVMTCRLFHLRTQTSLCRAVRVMRNALLYRMA